MAQSKKPNNRSGNSLKNLPKNVLLPFKWQKNQFIAPISSNKHFNYLRNHIHFPKHKFFVNLCPVRISSYTREHIALSTSWEKLNLNKCSYDYFASIFALKIKLSLNNCRE